MVGDAKLAGRWLDWKSITPGFGASKARTRKRISSRCARNATRRSTPYVRCDEPGDLDCSSARCPWTSARRCLSEMECRTGRNSRAASPAGAAARPTSSPAGSRPPMLLTSTSRCTAAAHPRCAFPAARTPPQRSCGAALPGRGHPHGRRGPQCAQFPDNVRWRTASGNVLA